MPTQVRPPRLSHEEYFALEQAEDQRYEYLAGEVFAMAGGSERHALIGANALIALGIALRERLCRVYGSDMKLYLATFDKFCCPDVQVLCGDAGRHERYVEDPVLVVEVISEHHRVLRPRPQIRRALPRHPRVAPLPAVEPGPGLRGAVLAP
jgi:Uma2 family endonuclease